MGRIEGKYTLALGFIVMSMLGNAFVSLASAGESFLTSPLPVRNMYAPMMRFFDPVPDSALRDYSNWDIELDQHLSNIYLADQWPANQLLVDMELYVADITVRKALTEDMDMSLRVSLLRPFNGVLDPLVNSVHDLLRIPTAGRNLRPNNTFGYNFRPGSGTGWQGRNRWEMDNVVISLRKQLIDGDGWAIAGLAAVQAPTASSNRGWGSGKPDAGLGAVASFSSDNWFMHMEAWGIYTFARDISASALPAAVKYQPYARGSVR